MLEFHETLPSKKGVEQEKKKGLEQEKTLRIAVFPRLHQHKCSPQCMNRFNAIQIVIECMQIAIEIS